MRDMLLQLLNDQKLRPAQLAQAAGISTSTVDDIVKGRANELNIGVDKMLRIANVLGVSVEYLYGRNEPPGSCQSLSPDLSSEERELLEDWRHATDAAKQSALMVLKANRRPVAKRGEAI